MTILREINRYLNILMSVAVEPTNDCNLDCSYCHRKMRPVGYMSLMTFRGIIDQIPRRCGVALSYGGESIMHPNFKAMVNIAHSKRFRKLNVLSNGVEKYPPNINVILYPKPPKTIFTWDQKIETPNHGNKPVNTYCDEIHRYMGVLWNGDVVPCCSSVSGNRVMGNIHYDTLMEIWNNEKYRELRKIGHCEGCELYKYNWSGY